MNALIKGLNINYQIIGEGKPLLILHGWGSRSEKWQGVGELLSKKWLKVIIPDLPGFGNSQKPSSPWGLDDYCNFIEEFIKFLNLDKFFLLGHSFGGALAVKCSLKFPEKIDKLFLIGAACIRKKNFKVRLLKFISKIFKSPPFFIKKVFYRKSDYFSVEGVIKETYLKIIKEDLTDILSQVWIPTIIIWGKEDNTTPIKHACLIRSKINNSKLEIMPGVSHSPHLEAPEKLAEIITKFL